MLIIYYLVSKRANLPLPAMVLLFFIVLFACRQGPQEEKYEYQGFHYEHFAWGLQITGYTGKSKDIKFPAQINNLPVISILGNEPVPFIEGVAFTIAPFENKNLNSVILPDTIRYINSGAFAENNLTEIHFPDNLSHIGTFAFRNNRLTSIVIPDSVWYSIGGYAFEGNQISDVTIGSGVERIEYAAFRNNKIASLTIPANIAFIGSYAFAGNEITELILSEGPRIIYVSAFEGNLLNSLSIPANVQIGYDAFKDNNITRLNIGKDVEIGYGAFIDNFITHIDIGKNIRLHKGDNFPVFELGFDEFFLGNESKAGTYLYENGKWEFMPGT